MQAMTVAHKSTCDVLIIGAGPAGAYLAYLLAAKGYSVAAIDKEAFPRYKVCGGGLCARSVKLLPFDIAPVVVDKTTAAFVSLRNRHLCLKKLDDPIIHMVKREDFDAFLIEKAVSKGIRFLDQTRLETITSSKYGVEVQTSSGSFKAQVVVGADGVHSKTALLTGLGPARNLLPAIEAEAFMTRPDLLEDYHGCVHFDLAIPPQGYGWIFPKAEHLSIGVFSTLQKEKGLKRAFSEYLEIKGLKESIRLQRLKGHMIPAGLKTRKRIASSNSLLVGDAAGFADPITGEGIYQALSQAELAAAAIGNFLQGSPDGLKTYERMVMKKFRKEHIYAWLLGAFFYRLPALSHPLLRRHSELVTDLHIDIITGKRSYKDLFKIALLLKRP